ncbi:hypothetical protein MTP99_003780 [Tenebrio molitor]|nr:hypothetical protein MTP99_003780 [Tenebrio molitor]
MDDLDLAILVCLEDEGSSEEETRGQECDIYKRRETKGAYEILIVRHLVPNDTKFKEYFRLSPELFHYVLNFKTKQSNKKADFSRTKTRYFSEARTIVLLL